MKRFERKMIAAILAILILLQGSMLPLAVNLEGTEENTEAPSTIINSPDLQENARGTQSNKTDAVKDISTSAAEDATIMVEGSTLFANGVPVILKSAENKTAYVYSLNGTKLSDAKISTVYGGAKNADVNGDVSITIEDAYLSNIYGGGYSDGSHSANVSGDVTITATGTKVVNVSGGGYANASNGDAEANVYGKITLNINSTVPRPNTGFTEAGHRIAGGGYASATSNNAQANVSDVQIYSTGPIYVVRGGGTANAYADKTGISLARAGDIDISIDNGDIREVYCGGYASYASADAEVGNIQFLAQNSEIMLFEGGGEAISGVANAGDINIRLEACPNIYGSFQGGGTARGGGKSSAGNVTIFMQDTLLPAALQWDEVVAAWTNGGGKASGADSVADVADTKITMIGGICAGTIFGGGSASGGAQANSGSVEINVMGTQGDEIEVSGKTSLYVMSVVGGADIDWSSTANMDSVVISIENSSLDLAMGGSMNNGSPCEPNWEVRMNLGTANKELQGIAYADILQIAQPIALKMFLPGTKGTVLRLEGNQWQGGSAVLRAEFADDETPIEWVANEDDQFLFEPEGNIATWKLKGAKIGEEKFLTLQEAVSVAKSGDTIELLADAKLLSSILINKELTIDGANHIIAGAGVIQAAKHNAFTLAENANLNLKNTNVITTHTAIRMEGAGAKLIIDDCNIDSKYYAIGVRNINQNVRVENSTLAGWAGIMTSAGGIGASDDTHAVIEVNNSTINAKSLDSLDGYGAITLQENFHKVNLAIRNTTFNIAKNEEFLPKKMAAIWVRSFGSTITAENCIFNLQDGASSEQGVITITSNTVKGYEEIYAAMPSNIAVLNSKVNSDGEYKTVVFNDTSRGSVELYRRQDFVRFNDTVYVSCISRQDKASMLQLKLEGGELEDAPVVLDNEVLLPSPERSGYNLEGWRNSQGELYKAEQKIIVTQDDTLIAEWRKITNSGSQDSETIPPVHTETESKTDGDVQTETIVTTNTNPDGSKTTKKSEIATNVATGEKIEIQSTQTVAKDGSTTKEETRVTTLPTGEITQQKIIASTDAKTGAIATTTVKTDANGKSSAVLVAEGGKGAKSVVIPPLVLIATSSADDAVMMVKTSVGAIAFDSRAVSAVAASGEIASISIEAANVKSLAPEVQQELKNAQVVDLSVSVGEQKLSNFNGGIATVEVAYSMADSTKQIAVYYVSPNGKMMRMSGASYAAEAASVKFPTSHFSYYAVVEEEALSFIDVLDFAWYYDAVRSAVRNKLFCGTSETRFEPDSAMTRGMLVEVLYRMGKPEQNAKKSPFSDIAADSYYTNAINWAFENKIIEGYNGKFYPDDIITREQLALVIKRYANSIGLDTIIDSKLDSFTDNSDVSAYAVDAMAWLCTKGIMQGIDGKIAPQSCATRAQVSMMLMRFDSVILE